MKVTKSAQTEQLLEAGESDLAQINRFTQRALTQEEVYTFSVRLCDNEVDRDGERFAPRTLEELAELFVGKSGIFDHQWSARGQAARVYRTEVIQEPERTTQAGDGYCWLKGYAYMVRTEAARDLIAEIEGGIKKEVSVGCAVERGICSICGADWKEEPCAHQKGQVYGQTLCFVSLEGAKDAYEFSFVAVPAQPQAGVVKGLGGELVDLKALILAHPECRKAVERLEEESRLGRLFLSQMRDEVVRLGLLSDKALDRDSLHSIASKLSWQELETLKSAYERRAAQRYPLKPQLSYGERVPERDRPDGAFLI